LFFNRYIGIYFSKKAYKDVSFFVTSYSTKGYISSKEEMPSCNEEKRGLKIKEREMQKIYLLTSGEEVFLDYRYICGN
jgi:hypothetical protein